MTPDMMSSPSSTSASSASRPAPLRTGAIDSTSRLAAHLRTIPSMMRAARSDDGGTPDVLEVRMVPVPTVAANEVLVRVHAAALNPKDRLLLARRARNAGSSRGVGFDLAGEVVVTGEHARDLAPGTRVFGFLDGHVGGTAAEYVSVPRSGLAVMPAALDWKEGAALPLVASTALQALRDIARIAAGERLLIKGASGGVGMAAIQIAKAMGMQVTALASGTAYPQLRSLGADEVVDAAAGMCALGRQFDVFLDCAGHSRFRDVLPVLMQGGRWVTVAPNVAVFALASLSAISSRLLHGPKLGYVIVHPRTADLDLVARLVAEGKLRMPVASVHPLESIADAHRALDVRGVIGKRVVLVGTPDRVAAAVGEPHTVRDRIAAILRRHGVPGVSVAVTDRDGLRWADGFGLADLRTRTPARADTVYHLFSGTKLFTAAAIMQLAERGLLSLDAPVSEVLPLAAGFEDITLRHLLSHRSGLKESVRGLLATTFPGERALTADEALANFPLRRRRPPGARVEYANVNYALLGAVISRVSGREYREYVREELLRPLGGELAFALSDATRARAATGYIGRWDPMRLVLRALFPDVTRRLYRERSGGLVALAEYDLATAAIGGLVGSMPDFARFLRSQLAGGGPILAPHSVTAMQSHVAAGAAGIMSREGVGLGWKLGRAGHHTFLNHEGGGAGFTSELRLYPHAGIGIALAMNVMRMPRTMRIAHELAEVVLSAEER